MSRCLIHNVALDTGMGCYQCTLLSPRSGFVPATTTPFGIPVIISEHALPGAMLIVKDRATVDALLAAHTRIAALEAENKRLREAGGNLHTLALLSHYACDRVATEPCADDPCVIKRALNDWTKALSTPTQEEGT